MTTKLTRREVITGTLAGATAAGYVYETIPLATSEEMRSSAIEQQLDRSMRRPAPIPTPEELRQWETLFKARYKAQHRARNEALEHAFEDIEPALRVDLAVEKVEADMVAAHALVTIPVQSVAGARDQGFGDRRAGRPATANPYWDALSKSLNHGYDGTYDEFMAWYAGWVQADPDLKLPRTAGYTPPQPSGATFT